jgi:hypothetical protein
MAATYYIAGHGGEGDPDGKIVLPAGCTVIARAKPGQFSISKAVMEGAKKIFCEVSDVYMQPLENMKKVVNAFGSVAVYRPGDLCPNFKFKLLVTHWRRNTMIVAPVAGLIPIPEDPLDRALICNAYSAETKRLARTTPAMDVIPDLFQFSVVPTREQVVEMIEEDSDSEDEDEDEDDEENENNKNKGVLTIEDVAGDDDSDLFVTLSDLLDIQADGSAGRPGIYYNFACRGVAVTDLYNIEKINGEGFLVPSHGESIPRAGPGPAAAKRLVVRQLLLNTIAEAEGRRKHLIRGTRYNRPPKPKGRKTRRRHRK